MPIWRRIEMHGARAALQGLIQATGLGDLRSLPELLARGFPSPADHATVYSLNATGDAMDQELVAYLDERFNQIDERFTQQIQGLREETKQQFQEQREETTEQFQELREETVQQFQGLREETARQVQGLREETKQQFQELREETAQQFQGLREETTEQFQELREETTRQVQGLRAETNQQFQEQREETVRQVQGLREETSQRFDRMEETIRHTDIKLEGLRDDIRQVAEGVAMVEQKLDSFRDTVTKELGASRSQVEAYFGHLNRRVRDLERRPSQPEI